MVFIKDGDLGKMREGRFLFVGGYGGGLCAKGIIFFFISMQLLSRGESWPLLSNNDTLGCTLELNSTFKYILVKF